MLHIVLLLHCIYKLMTTDPMQGITQATTASNRSAYVCSREKTKKSCCSGQEKLCPPNIFKERLVPCLGSNKIIWVRPKAPESCE